MRDVTSIGITVDFKWHSVEKEYCKKSFGSVGTYMFIIDKMSDALYIEV
jgi:hypothetical protein